MSASGAMMRESAAALLDPGPGGRRQVRADASATDLLRLVHAVSMAVDRPPVEDGQADRMIALIADGLRYQPGT